MYQLWTMVLFCGLLFPTPSVILSDPAPGGPQIQNLGDGYLTNEKSYGAVGDKSNDPRSQQYNADKYQYGGKDQPSAVDAINIRRHAKHRSRSLAPLLKNGHGARRVARGLPIGVYDINNLGVTGADSGSVLTRNSNDLLSNIISNAISDRVKNTIDDTASTSSIPNTPALLGNLAGSQGGLLGGLTNSMAGASSGSLLSGVANGITSGITGGGLNGIAGGVSGILTNAVTSDLASKLEGVLSSVTGAVNDLTKSGVSESLQDGVPGGSGILDGVVGSNGPAGNIHGEKDSLLSNVMKSNGVLGGILGGSGGLIGNALGGKGGFLSGILGQNRLIPNIISGKDSLLDNILNGGLVGGIIDSNSILQKLLGPDGLLGDVLGAIRGGLQDLPGGNICSYCGSSNGRGVHDSILEPKDILEGVPRGDPKILLGSVPGREGGILNGLLGQNGLLGCSLGSESGLLDCLLDEKSIIGRVLGSKSSLLNGLIGEKSIIGRVLGNDGSLSGGQKGLLGSILGSTKQLLGGILGQNGLVGQLLGKNGLIGQHLSKDGIIGQLLGKDGLLGCILGFITKMLFPEHNLLGILGKGGELGPLENIPSVKISDILPPKVSLIPLVDNRMQLSLQSEMEVGGQSPMGHKLYTSMTVNIISIAHLTTDKDGSPKVILESCQTTYENLVVKALNGVKGEILQSLKSLLDKFMPDVMCPVPDMMLTLLNGMLKDMSGTVPPSSSGALQNTPNRLLINFPTAYGQKMCYV